MGGRSAEDKDEADDPDKWLWMHCEGSRDGYKDMELFIGTVRDPGRADRLEIAISGRGAFRRSPRGGPDRRLQPAETNGRSRDRTWVDEEDAFTDIHPQASDLPRTHALPRLRRVFGAAPAAHRVWPVRQEPGARPNAIPEMTNRGFRRARAAETAGLAADLRWSPARGRTTAGRTCSGRTDRAAS